MHAIRLHAFGPAENLVIEQLEDPRPGPGQVRIASGGYAELALAQAGSLRALPTTSPTTPPWR